MVGHAVRLAASAGLAAVRLDVLPGNLPAEELYMQQGFSYIATRSVYYEDVGWADMNLYEYVI